MWPSAVQFSEAVQNPKTCFSDPELRSGSIAVDKLGMPFAASGQFAVVFKLKVANRTHAIRCFTRDLGDRAARYQAIDSHLASCTGDNRSVSRYLAGFEYDRDGIAVGGRRYPILIMDWIEGCTLDIYVEQVIGNTETLLNVASEWLRLIKALKDTRIAHGDLQHGNVIVALDSQLKLVDFDGMFVPNMAGFKACELGHVNYQHPNRVTRDFDLGLDNFSALVIYVSLLIAAHQPHLWRRFHDEGLMFKRSDFENPASSGLFKSLNRSDAEFSRFARILMDSCRAPIGSVPSLVDLVTVEAKPHLPAWMTGTSVPSPTVKTREAPKPEEIVAARPLVTAKPVGTAPPSGVPSPWPPRPSPTYTPNIKPAFSGTRFIAALIVWLMILLIPWSIIAFGVAAGSQGWFWVSTCCYLTAAVMIAHRSARTERTLPQKTPTYSPPTRARPTVTQQAPIKPPSYRTPVSGYPGGRTTSASTAIVASNIRYIYHRPSCKWARKISGRNRVVFLSRSEAERQGFRRCKVCYP